MRKRDYPFASASMFLLLASLHVVIVVTGFAMVIGGWEVPKFVNLFAVAIFTYLAYVGYQLEKGSVERPRKRR